MRRSRPPRRMPVNCECSISASRNQPLMSGLNGVDTGSRVATGNSRPTAVAPLSETDARKQPVTTTGPGSESISKVPEPRQ